MLHSMSDAKYPTPYPSGYSAPPYGRERIANITDGTSNTMMAGTVNDGFKAWGDPTNHRDPSSGFGGGPTSFGAPNRRFVTILMFDGSVRERCLRN